MKRTAMICDDSPLFRKDMRHFLHEAGFQRVLEASDGYEAAALFKQEHPDVVFMDIIMPKLDGISALKKIAPHKGSAYIIMTSSCSEKSHLRRALHLGADTFIQKPLQQEKTTEVLHQAPCFQSVQLQ
ncbi:response regulator [Alkalicoccus chagannorensis]|uniref:response regulator n=1 Tax=Alkalicoccus chagannorensis TaxID=427072 RepID=UPI00041B1080|nr:response regulator [Alkalicoccus chagannorensis]